MILSKFKNDVWLTLINLLLVVAPFISINFLSQIIGLYFLISLYLFFLKKEEIVLEFKKLSREFPLFFLPIIVLIISLIWTENLARGFDQVFKRLPLVLMPFSFFVQRFFWKRISHEIILQFYVLCSTIFSLYGFLIIYLFYPVDYKTNLTFIHLRYLLENEILHIHPVYLGLFSGLAAVLAFYFGIKNLAIKRFYSILLFTVFIVNIFTMFFISARMPILVTLVCISVLLFMNKKYNVLGVMLLLFLGAVFSVQYFFPGYRFNEVFEALRTPSTALLNQKNTISTRYVIYNCVIELFSENPIIGYGIGDIQGQMFECTEYALGEFKFNSHNQYLEYLISTGVFGLLSFIIFLYFLGKKFFTTKNSLGILVLLFFILIFLTENLFARTRGVFIFSFMIYFIYFFYDASQRTKNYH